MTQTPPPAPLAAADFKKAMAQFATGVTIVSAQTPQGELVGLTVNSFNSVSLDPALVLWSISKQSKSLAALQTVSHYAIQVLAADQAALAQQFAGPALQRWHHVDYTLSSENVPILNGTLMSLICRPRSQYDEGDHLIWVADVVRCQHATIAKAPLVYHASQFATLESAHAHP
jgi:flavin reductase (DIM6/NTAB) family NADH-FMN oxidoreductase RutF